MADNIVSSLFGISPEMFQQQQAEQDYAQALKIGANASAPGTMMSPSLAPFYTQAAQQGQLIGKGAGALFGIEDPELAMVRDVSEMRKNFDTSSIEGLRSFSQALAQKGYTPLAMQAAKAADDREAVQAQTGLREAQTKQAAAGKFIQVDLGDRVQIIDPITKEVIREERKGAKPSAGGEGGGGVAGPVGKAGAWRDADGIVYSAAEMAKQRAGFQGLEKLADNLNAIKPEDVKNAESWIDYTSSETAKTVGGKASPKTVAAQAKINAAQLLKQIESLPPGSASNADMISAKSSFPGYGNAKNLDAWILDTKTKLDNSMQRQSEQYGFKPKVTVTKLDGTPSASKNPNQDALDWIAANPNDPRVPAMKKKLGIK